ncbi:hypothetical protein [Streptomyces chromofuscus]|uniref:hypothetical protein n=1 Tax=Streptomyces chromofuscus TaxID=42881 RepID=UPI001671ECB5|nr:hypothetical protein [Streptomyces chromofuscus]GGT03892.1 hypothetical protein GCM10010254_25320 [Streptomyces chromofuscus]
MSGAPRGRRPGITVGRLAVLVVLALVVAVGATLLATWGDGGGGQDGRNGAGAGRPSPAPSVDGTPYAYTTEKELVLMRGDRPLARVPRVFDLADTQQNTVVWTHDGRRLAFFSDDALLERTEDTRLITVDARTGEVRRLPCPGCYDLAPVAEHEVAVLRWDSDATRALRFDLTRPKAAGTEITAPAGNGSSWQIRFLGGTRSHLLTAQYTTVAGSDTAMDLRLLDRDGQEVAAYPPFDSNAYMPAALATLGDRERIAVAARQNPGGCAAPFPIHPLGLNGEVGGSDQSAALPPGFLPGVTGGIEVNDLWWGPDRHLYATISAWTCDNSRRAEDDKQRLHRPATLFRLDGDKWVSAGDQPATVVRPLDRDTRMVLAIPDCVGRTNRDDGVTYCNTGTLHRERDGKRTEVADGVLSLSAPATVS